MASDLNLSPGHQSEPTTPPEYRDNGFPSMYSRQNRYSSSSLVSPPGLTNRLSRSGSQLTSPPVESVQGQNGDNSDKLPSKSVPGSRRGSTDRFSSYIPENNVIGQRPVTKYVFFHLIISFLSSQVQRFLPWHFLFGDIPQAPFHATIPLHQRLVILIFTLGTLTVHYAFVG